MVDLKYLQNKLNKKFANLKKRKKEPPAIIPAGPKETHRPKFKLHSSIRSKVKKVGFMFGQV